MIEIRYYHNEETGEPHIYDHGVSEREVEEVLRNRAEDQPGSEGSRVALGQTEQGRYLRVIYAPDWSGQGLFVITAYDLTGKAPAAYRRRMRKRGLR